MGHKLLLWSIRGEGVCTRQVDEVKERLPLSVVRYSSCHSHTGIIAYLLVRATGSIEERGLATIWITDKGDRHLTCHRTLCLGETFFRKGRRCAD